MLQRYWTNMWYREEMKIKHKTACTCTHTQSAIRNKPAQYTIYFVVSDDTDSIKDQNVQYTVLCH